MVNQITQQAINSPWAIFGVILAGLGSIGGLSGLVAIRNARSLQRKTDAEAAQSDALAAQAITNAATSLVTPLQGEVTRLGARVASLETDANVQRMLLVEHSVWDHLALARMSDAGVELPPIPPLFPAKVPAAEVHVEVRTDHV